MIGNWKLPPRHIGLAWWLLALCVCGSKAASEQAHPGTAQSEQETILSVVDDFFVALHMNDLEAAEAMLSEHASITIIVEDGVPSVSNPPVSEFFDRFRGIPPGEFVEQYWNPVVLRRGGLAVFWAPYYVDIAGERSHCGIDVLSLAQHETGWKFESLVFSVEPHACDELGIPSEGLQPPFPTPEVSASNSKPS